MNYSLAAYLVLPLALATAQEPVQLRGRVVADEGETPIRNARVALASDAIASPVVLTDDQGRFALPASSGAVRIRVSKAGYGPVERRHNWREKEKAVVQFSPIGG
jgi:Carboxypeptidase regulatory-like domain